MHASHSVDEERKIQIRNRNVCHRMLHQYFRYSYGCVSDSPAQFYRWIYTHFKWNRIAVLFSLSHLCLGSSVDRLFWRSIFMLCAFDLPDFIWPLPSGKSCINWIGLCFVFYIMYERQTMHTFFTQVFFSLHFTIVYQQLETGVRFAYLWNVCPIRCVTIWWLWLFDWGGFVLCQGSNAWYHHSTSANVIGFSLIVCVHVRSQRQRMIIFPVFAHYHFWFSIPGLSQLLRKIMRNRHIHNVLLEYCTQWEKNTNTHREYCGISGV